MPSEMNVSSALSPGGSNLYAPGETESMFFANTHSPLPPLVVWFTGLSGAGKSTTSIEVKKKLNRLAIPVCLLDGDQIRTGLCADLGFSDQDRKENIRRTAEVAKLMLRPGAIILVAVISPFAADRENAKRIIGTEHFLEIYMNTELATCEARDVKGLYHRARNGTLKNFTGIDSTYEPPLNAHLTLNSTNLLPSQAGDKVVRAILQWQNAHAHKQKVEHVLLAAEN